MGVVPGKVEPLVGKFYWRDGMPKYGDWKNELRWNLRVLKDRVLGVLTLGLGRGIIYQVPAPPRRTPGMVSQSRKPRS